MTKNDPLPESFVQHCDQVSEIIMKVDDRGIRDDLRKAFSETLGGVVNRGWAGCQMHWVREYDIPDTLEGLFDSDFPNA